MTITGTIESIEYRDTVGHEKKVVTVKGKVTLTSHQNGLKYQSEETSFVEFRGINMGFLNPVKKNDNVEIEVFCDGKVSRNSGIQYNNLVGMAIKKI